MTSTLDLIDTAIADLEAKLHLAPGASSSNDGGATTTTKMAGTTTKKKQDSKQQKRKQQPSKRASAASTNPDQPDICKLEFKVGQITKVWEHPDADKLYCEEIDVGEEEPRQIASGLRPHFTKEQMLGQRLLVVSNLKPKNLVGFKSHGMVLCAALSREDGSEKVEFVEPPDGAQIGEVVTFQGLPPPEPWSASQVDKKKVFAACMDGMKTTADQGLASWNGHIFLTSAGPCKCQTIKGGVLR